MLLEKKKKKRSPVSVCVFPRALWCSEAVDQHRKAPGFLFQDRCFVCNFSLALLSATGDFEMLFFFFFFPTVQTKSSIVPFQLMQAAQESRRQKKRNPVYLIIILRC